MGFVDDAEFALDGRRRPSTWAAPAWAVRDFGVNRTRIEAIRSTGAQRR
jgi:uncharacterized protein (DUF1499 family)